MAGEHEPGKTAPPILGRFVGALRRNRWTGLVVNITPSGVWLLVFFLAPSTHGRNLSATVTVPTATGTRR